MGGFGGGWLEPELRTVLIVGGKVEGREWILKEEMGTKDRHSTEHRKITYKFTTYTCTLIVRDAVVVDISEHILSSQVTAPSLI